MSTFVEAVKNQTTRTENGMRARKSTANACVDFFFKSGASRGKDITKDFVAAYAEDKDVALRIAQWMRDVRGGSGERELFRQVMKYLEKNDKAAAAKLLAKAPEIGRWDDIFVFEDQDLKAQAFTMLGNALRAKNGLAAKWTPRQGPLAVEIRNFYGMSPKFYRKSLVELTNVVEQKMCAKDWDGINFSHVPSLAASRYKKAFTRNTSKFAEYVAKLVKGDDPEVKVNAAAVYPYDVLKGVASFNYKSNFNETELNHIIKQWEALPNFIGDANILPLVDVSGSMNTSIAGSKTTCMDVAVSLGLYLSDKNKGKFKDTFLTFSSQPELLHLKGNVVQKAQQMVKSKWDMSTDLHKAMDKILNTAVDHNVPQEEMPEMLLILSDMQFNGSVSRSDESAMNMIERKFAAHGYKMPAIVFWNLNSKDNVPVKHDKSGVALVSGFSPAIVKSVLSSDMEQFTPEGIMLKTVMVDRYALVEVTRGFWMFVPNKHSLISRDWFNGKTKPCQGLVTSSILVSRSIFRMYMKLKPLNKNVAIVRLKNKLETESGIILKRNLSDVDRAKVIAIGPEVKDVKVDDVLLVDWNKAAVNTFDGIPIYMISEENVVAVFDDLPSELSDAPIV